MRVEWYVLITDKWRDTRPSLLIRQWLMKAPLIPLSIMFTDQRRAERRRPLNGVAMIHLKTGPRPYDSRVVDLSESGARLYVEAEVPDWFALVMADSEPLECRVVWRLGYEVGVEFIEDTDPMTLGEVKLFSGELAEQNGPAGSAVEGESSLPPSQVGIR